MKYDLSSLNDNQREVAVTIDRPVLVIAGPGSGKTKTLVERVLYLIVEKEVKPEKIFIATFTEKAAKELITRISNKLLELEIRVNLHEMFIGTLHSIFLRILEDYRPFTRLKRNYKMLDQFDQQYFIYQRMRAFEKVEDFSVLIDKTTSRWNKAEKIVVLLNKISEEYLDVDTLLESNDIAVKVLGGLYQCYTTLLEESNAVDFSAIQTEMYKLIDSQPEILQELQDKIAYIMIDEYQDTNTIQEMILLKLAESHHRICAVGDDDQGLYRFRGASIRNILEFARNFQNDECKKVYLSTNYRSHPDIVNFSKMWIEGCEWEYEDEVFRFEKNIVPDNREFTDNPAVIKVSGEVEKDNWHEQIYEFICALKDGGKITDLNQIAFIFSGVKSEKTVRLAGFLESKGIYVYSPRSNLFFQRDEIRFLIGAFVFLFPQFQEVRKWDDNAHLKIWDYYDECLLEFGKELRKEENRDLAVFCAKKGKYHLNLTENTNYSFSGLFFQLLQFPFFSRFVDVDLNSAVFDVRPAYNLGLFSCLLNKYEYLHNISIFSKEKINDIVTGFFNQYLRFLVDGGISEYEDFEGHAPSGCVSFLTVHQSKGLEFPVVIADSLGSVPRKSYDALDEILQNNYYRKPPFEPLEQTKYYDFYRLYNVAFSRAMDLLVLSCQEKEGRGRSPSKYFENVYKKAVSWKDPSFDMDKLTLRKVGSGDIKNQYSFTSHILLYENCARQYRFFKELEFAPVRKGAIIFGNLVHQTIEDIHRAVLKNEREKITHENITDWFNENYVLLTKSERVYLTDYVKKNALEQVFAYEKTNRSNWDKIVEAEVDVSLVKDEYILKGTIDLVKGENETVEIIDFKSVGKPDVNNPRDKEELDRYKRQLEVYAHLVEERTGHKVSKMSLYYTSELSGNPYIDFPWNEKSINNTIGKFDDVVSKIERNDFTITERPEKRVCNNCDMRFYCDRNC